MNIPKNCLECEHGNDCKAAYYGSNLCKHEKAINRKAIDNMLSEKAGGGEE